MAQLRETSPWWSEFELDMGQGLQWNLGSFQLIVLRQAGEWLLAHETTSGEETEPGLGKVTPVSEVPADHPGLVRFAADRQTKVVKMVPRAADRSVVVKPHLPLHLLASEETRIYVSSPAWLEVTVGRPDRSLREFPMRVLSDTWFGPNTLEGEVAYALKTRARVQLADMPMRTYRIITPITIRNEGRGTLLVDRMNLPVPYLSVYTSSDGFLWTEPVTLVRNQGAELASLEVGTGAPKEARGGKRLSEPRRSGEASLLVRAFSSLLNPFLGEDRA
jgi:hypothetical protein